MTGRMAGMDVDRAEADRPLFAVVRPRLIAGAVVAGALLVSACTGTEDIVAPNIDPPITTLAALDVVEEFPTDGVLTVKRHKADAAGRFALAVGPLQGTERERAFSIAETAYARICGQPYVPGSNGVGRTGSRAPFFNVKSTTYLVYMQCQGAPLAPASSG
ncbi:MAG: hypothetical protein AAGF28_07080 [Pseudomonadota bacterium]